MTLAKPFIIATFLGFYVMGVNVIAQNNLPDSTYSIVDQMPEFTGGEKEMYKYIQQNIHYPEIERQAGITGKVYIKFIVDKGGNISDVLEMRGVPGGIGLTEEAIRVVKSMPQWKAGMQNGRTVNVKMVLPLNFSIKNQSPVTTIAQTDTVFYDKNDKKTSLKDSTDHYSIKYLDKDDTTKFTIKTYFKSGQIKSEISYKKRNFNGLLQTYWDNGKIKRETISNRKEIYFKEKQIIKTQKLELTLN